MRGISVRPDLVGAHIGGNDRFPPSHREFLLRLASDPFFRRNRSRDAGVDLPKAPLGSNGLVCHSINSLKHLLVCLLLYIPTLELRADGTNNAQLAIASLTDPNKLATLKGERAANPRLQKCVYWLAYAEEQGQKPEVVLDESSKINKTDGTPYAGFVRWGFLENLKIAKELGLLTPEGMAELRRGKSATITKGQYAGQEAEADHTIPRSVCLELQNQVMNLELMPASLNRAKSDKVTERAKVFAKELYDAKLLSEAAWKRVNDAE